MWTSSRPAAKASSVYKASLTKGRFDIAPSNWHDFSDSIHASLPKECVQLITRAFKRKVYVPDKQWFFTLLICLMNWIILQVCLSASCLFKVYCLVGEGNFVQRIPLLCRCLRSRSSWIGHGERCNDVLPDPHSYLNTEGKHRKVIAFQSANVLENTFYYK